MAEHAWRDLIVGDRMRVDQEFADRVRQSGFSTQEWSLIMTAVQLELEAAGDGVTLVADTTHVPTIVPELERINQQMRTGVGASDRGGKGPLESLKSALGFGGGVDEETVRRAETLAGEYAAALEAHLRETGKWETVRAHG